MMVSVCLLAKKGRQKRLEMLHNFLGEEQLDEADTKKQLLLRALVQQL